ncbi:YeeE/YedE family protein [Sulfitobacter sabulilitoris]|uniref:YeeE/YedE family protein n=1 Tax=Sulfitobacter sabulilitoris TaxID=2562655 RepID=A0A5S3PFN2_9RHOB|nr:YeeE/YedE family protein [Sulfitobacter sabulilitoris]TMM52838.1 YeeE/YedE family protein [Sulfitobacter sabulilitoris]
MLSGLSEPMLIALIGCAGGVLLGLAARLGRFCTLGSIEDVLYQSSDVRLRMWGLAIGIAGLASFGLAGLGALDLSQTLYYRVPWSPLASVLGGLMFGYGMSMAGNCGFGALARFGGGDLRSFVIVTVMGLSAFVMLSGPLAGLRVSFEAATAISSQMRGYPDLLQGLTGLPVVIGGLLISLAITLASLGARHFLADRRAVLWGTVVGLAVASGWAGTQWVADTGFSGQTVVSHTFSAPLGETMLYLMTSSGGGLSFGVGSVFGVLAGAFCGSLIKGHFRWEACEDPRELKRQILGAVLMGFGAVLAVGCTIGQGISAFSVLSFSAPITFAAIFAGAAIGLRQLITGFA